MVARPTTGARSASRTGGCSSRTSSSSAGSRPSAARPRRRPSNCSTCRPAQPLLAERLPVAPSAALRATAHRIADLVFERLTGIPGAFSTRIAYVSVEGTAAGAALPPDRRRRRRLQPAHRDRIERADHVAGLVAGRPEPRVRVVRGQGVGDLRAAARDRRAPARLGARRHQRRAGLVADGRELALTLSRDGNLDIYMLDLATQALTRVTSDDAIDTEPEWSRDGAEPLFHVRPGRQRAGLPRGARRARRRPSA